MRGSVRERFEARVIRPDDGGCWEWAGGHFAEGYAALTVDSQSRGAHRVAYMLYVGPIPEGLQIDHLCRNRGCVNPAHLEAVTQRENLARGISPIAARMRVGPQPMTKRERLYPEVKRLREVEGLMWREIGDRLGLSLKTVHNYYSDPDGDKRRNRVRAHAPIERQAA